MPFLWFAIDDAPGPKSLRGYVERNSIALLIGDPGAAPYNPGHVCARPDETSDDGRSWRARLLDDNRNDQANALGLLPAWQLYQHDSYGRLVRHFGEQRVFILIFSVVAPPLRGRALRMTFRRSQPSP